MGKPLVRLPMSLRVASHPARLWHEGDNGRVTCELSPRQCNIPIGGVGFCGVRHNDGGRLVTLNYGKSVAMTRESIETEAVYHYAPGEAILSLGNIGCMMACDFCHNWQTSQARHARDQDIHAYSAEDVVEYALAHDIRILSWTYNDPVVWHEFVLDTAWLAREHGIKNLYKSAFYIGPRAVDELLEVIDVFSVSLKSMDPEFYRKITKGRLQPVLDAIKRVYDARSEGAPHLEISNLCVTGRNDNLEDSLRIAHWMLEHLDADIPLHYVRFHPDYKYTHVARTSVAFLEEARQAALDAGLRHVYIGNVYDTEAGHTSCSECGVLLIERRGAHARALVADGRCPGCAAPAPIVLPFAGEAANSSMTTTTTTTMATMPARGADGITDQVHAFRGDVQALHVEQDHEREIFYQLVTVDGLALGEPESSSCHRFLIANSDARAHGVRIAYQTHYPPRLFEVFDRAHFPTVDVGTAMAPDDERPLPSCPT